MTAVSASTATMPATSPRVIHARSCGPSGRRAPRRLPSTACAGGDSRAGRSAALGGTRGGARGCVPSTAWAGGYSRPRRSATLGRSRESSTTCLLMIGTTTARKKNRNPKTRMATRAMPTPRRTRCASSQRTSGSSITASSTAMTTMIAIGHNFTTQRTSSSASAIFRSVANGTRSSVTAIGYAPHMRKLIVLAIALFALSAQAEQKNVQLLTNMSDADLLRAMNMMRASLGVHCDFCQVVNKATGLDFPSDEKNEKKVSREIISMVLKLNKEQFGGRTQIGCNTCHRGAISPKALVSLPQTQPPFPTPKPERPELPALADVVKKYAAAVGDTAKW